MFHDLHLYQVESPGSLQSMDLMKDVMDMEYYYDVPTGKVYYTAVINSVADLNKKDSVFAAMISRMGANNYTFVSQKNILKQNYDGRDVIFKASPGPGIAPECIFGGCLCLYSNGTIKKSGGQRPGLEKIL